MARHPGLDPATFYHAGGATGVLLIHGFTGAPPEMRPLGDYLAQHGYSVLCPLLPGHGTQPEDLNQVRWQDWTHAVANAYQVLDRRCDAVYGAGLSLGGLLALYLAVQEPSVAGLLLFAPGLQVADWRLPLTPIAQRVRPLYHKEPAGTSDHGDPDIQTRIWSYELYPVGGAAQLWFLQRAVRRQLARVHQPIILFQGRRDSSVRASSPQAILRRVSSTDTQMAWLEQSGHILTLDIERQFVFETCLAWLQRREHRAA